MIADFVVGVSKEQLFVFMVGVNRDEDTVVFGRQDITCTHRTAAGVRTPARLM